MVYQSFRTIVLIASILGTFSCTAHEQEVREFPKVGPILRSITPNQAVIMGQGNRHHDVQGVYRYAEISKDNTVGTFSNPISFSMDDGDRRVGMAFLDNLKTGTKYQIQIGYSAKTTDLTHMNWNHAHQMKIMTQEKAKSDTFSFLAGSCRRLAEVMGVTLWDEKGDKIFNAMHKDIQITQAGDGETDLIAFIGDQIYADATPFDKCESFKEYAERYELAFSQPFLKKLMGSGIPIYMMRDDHEWWNDADKEAQDARPDQNKAAKRAYDLYERPLGKATPEWYYSTTGNIDIFFMDTRSEREPSNNLMISQAQMDALKNWLIQDGLKDRLKFVVSSVPMFLLDTEDSWGGYKKQLGELLKHITENKIEGVVVLSGDAHCENDALFTISDKDGNDQGQILEILVSGLFAIARNKAGSIDDHMNLKSHGFYVKAKDGIQPTLMENLFARISGNHKEKTVDLWVYDADNNKLKESHYNLKK